MPFEFKRLEISGTILITPKVFVDYCELHPEDAWKINVEGTKNVAESCNPTLVDSLGEFLLSLYEKDRSGVFNISGKDNISRFEFSM